MQIVVIDYPKHPEECLFSWWDCEYGWICKFENKKCNVKDEKCKHLLEAWKSQG